MLKRYLLYSAILFSFASCSTAYVALDPVDEFEIDKYLGKWYEQYRLPNKLEEGLEEIVIYYELSAKGNVVVTNEGRLIDNKNKVQQTKGKVWAPDANDPSKLKISFYWYKANDHWIFKVDEGYKHALVGDPAGRHLWLLSRSRTPDMKTMALMLEYAASLGFPVEYLIRSLVD